MTSTNFIYSFLWTVYISIKQNQKRKKIILPTMTTSMFETFKIVCFSIIYDLLEISTNRNN